MAENPGNVALVHIDVDLYSAAHAVLELLNDRIVPSTVIVFDDMADWNALKRGSPGTYENWQEDEWKALLEWTATHARRFAIVSRGARSVLAIRVLV